MRTRIYRAKDLIPKEIHNRRTQLDIVKFRMLNVILKCCLPGELLPFMVLDFLHVGKFPHSFPSC